MARSSSVDMEERQFFGLIDTPIFHPPMPSREPPSERPGQPTGVAGWTAKGMIAALRRHSIAGASGARNLPAITHQAISLELARGTAFSFVPVLMAVGALWYFLAALEPSIWALLGASSTLAAAVALARRHPPLQLVLAAFLCVALGASLAKLETLRAGTRTIGGDITTRLTGRIVATDLLANGRTRLTLDVVATERPKLRYAPDRVRVSTRSVLGDVKAGSVITGPVRLMPPLGPIRPGSYDFSFESYFDGIGATGFFLGEPKVIDDDQALGWFDRMTASVENARDAIAERIRRSVGGAEGEIAAALITGVRAGIPEEVNEALRRTGLAHILSISGLHMALVAAAVMETVRRMLACFPNFASRHPIRKYAASVALFVLAAYLSLSGYQVAAQRSFIMIAIMLVAVLFDHAALTMRNLAISAIAILIVSPHEVVGPSFQMSFAATAALIGAYAAWSERKRSHPRTQLHWGPVAAIVRSAVIVVLGLAATSLIAGAATTIFGAYHFQRVSPLSLAANLTVMPFVSFIVMPFGGLGLLLMPFGLDAPAFAIMRFGLSAMIATARWFSDRSPLDAVGMVAPAAVVSLTIALILATLLTTWLRLAALPFLLAGLAFCLAPPRPAVFIADDASLVAFLTDDGKLAVNRRRPNDFALQNWMRSMAVDETVKPQTMPGGTQDPSKFADGRFFRCGDTMCIGRAGGRLIATLADASQAQSLCGQVGLLVVADPATKPICTDGTHVITLRDLARGGSAMIMATDESSPPTAGFPEKAETASMLQQANAAEINDAHGRTVPPYPGNSRIEPGHDDVQVVFAVDEPYRPWHAHRRYSREARGLQPWKPDPSKKKEFASPSARPGSETESHAPITDAQNGAM